MPQTEKPAELAVADAMGAIAGLFESRDTAPEVAIAAMAASIGAALNVMLPDPKLRMLAACDMSAIIAKHAGLVGAKADGVAIH